MDAEQFEATLKEAEVKLRRLRALYDQWFAGVERLEPHAQRDEMMRVLARLKAMPPRNTGLRFRLNQLSQQFTTYQTYWKRVTRQIEEGTYKRDVLRARRQRDELRAPPPPRVSSQEAETSTDAGADALDVDLSVDFSAAPPPAAPNTPGASISPLTTFRPPSITPLARPDAGEDASRAKSAQPPPSAGGATRSRTRRSSRPPAHAGGALPDAQMRALYDRYLRARRSNAERIDNVSYDRLAKQVQEMLPKLRAKHPGKQVGFAVIVRDGKVALKPVTK